MRTYPIKTPRIIQSIFGKYRWRFETERLTADEQIGEIYLTFDDGPIPELTPWVLQQLSKYNAKATFFCVGENVKRHPEIFQKILSEKHSIGNHTNSHLNGWKTNKEVYLNNIEKAEANFKSSVTGLWSPNETQTTGKSSFKTNLFRPPYGKIRPGQAKKILNNGYDIIMWDVLSGDFDLSLSKESCLNNVLRNTESGSIIVFHDSEKAFKNLEYVLPRVLEYFTEKGYVFKAI